MREREGKGREGGENRFEEREKRERGTVEQEKGEMIQVTDKLEVREGERRGKQEKGKEERTGVEREERERSTKERENVKVLKVTDRSEIREDHE